MQQCVIWPCRGLAVGIGLGGPSLLELKPGGIKQKKTKQSGPLQMYCYLIATYPLGPNNCNIHIIKNCFYGENVAMDI